MIKTAITLLIACGVRVAGAQVVTDGTVGPAGPLQGPNFVIDSGRGALRGPNLFHSFSRFDLAAGESATFTGPTSVAHVFARVTGGQPSSIGGLVRSDIAGANLYLINPNGILFGPGAQIDVTGSFAATTADVVRLADGGRFDARTPANDVLTTAPPAAFGFLGTAPAAITVRGDLAAQARPLIAVRQGQSVSIVGGDVSITTGDVGAIAGKVNLISVASPGEVAALDEDDGPSLAGFARLGEIELRDSTTVSAGGDPAGTVRVRAARLTADNLSFISSNAQALDGAPVGVDVRLTGDLVFTNAAAIFTGAFGAGAAGDIRVVAPRVRLESVAEFASSISSIALSDVAGAGGDVHITAAQVELVGRGEISTLTGGPGRGGNVRIAADSVALLLAPQFSGSPAISASAALGAPGTSGNITIDVGVLSIREAGRISVRSLGTQPGGLATINADQLLATGAFAFISADSAGAVTGEGGGLRIRARLMTLDDGAIVSTDTFSDRAGGDAVIDADALFIRGDSAIQSLTSFAGDGGRITVRARVLDMDGPSGGITASSAGTGRGGTIRVEAAELRMAGGTELRTAALGGGGAGGPVTVVAEQIVMRESASITATSLDSLDAGTIDIDARNITLRGPLVTVSSNTVSEVPGGVSGRGGVVRIRADAMLIADGAVVAASTNSTGDAGDINLQVLDALTIRGGNPTDPGGIFSRTRAPTPGAGDAGNIRVRTPRLSLQQGATITAASTGTGDAGNVTIEARDVSLDSNSSIATSGGDFANGGSINIAAANALDVRNSRITAQAANTPQAARDGGNVSIAAGERVYLEDSALTAEAGNDGGNITIDSNTLALNNSRVVANAVQGNGGDITIRARAFIPSNDSVVSASSQFGLTGQIEISAPDRDIAAELVALPQGLADAAARLYEFCSTRIDDYSSFISINRGGVPATPGQPIHSFDPTAVPTTQAAGTGQ